MSRILIISAQQARRSHLQIVCSFIGEESVVKENLAEADDLLQPATLVEAVIVDGERRAQNWVTEAASAFANLPFIVINDVAKLEKEIPNVVGSINEPIIYSDLIRCLYRCQEYVRQHPTRDNSSCERQFHNFVGVSNSIGRVKLMIRQVAPTDANVLVLGESGTGKEVIASNIHHLSNRHAGPFIPVNCGAIPAELLESELFGHEKGAFTGAISTRRGRFELAQGGTLFLDEIGDMPLQMQVKLLRVLQERSYERVGGTKPINCNVRIIAATHRNLEAMIASGDFREDLYYRLNVFPIDNPPLRDRREDIPLLLQEIVSRFEAREGRTVKLTEEALTSLSKHNWAGNVRELSNLVERMIILYPNQVASAQDLPVKYQHGELSEFQPDYPDDVLEREALNSLFGDVDDNYQATDEEEVEQGFSVHADASDTDLDSDMNLPQPDSFVLPDEGVNLKDYLADLEVDMITKALQQHNWVVARTAEFLGMRRTTLVEKMRKYSIAKD